MKENLMKPELAVIKKIVDENPYAKTFTVQFKKKSMHKKMFFLPGKFMSATVFGYGEIPLGISSSPYRKESFDLTVMNVGKTSNAMHQLKKGDLIGVRGPFGKGFPLSRFQKHNIVLIAGGTGLVPIKSIIEAALDKRKMFGKLFLFCGAKSPEMFCFKKDLQRWCKSCNVLTSVDKADKKWLGHIGFVTEFIDKVDFPIKKTVAVICGPALMIDIAAKELNKKGLQKGNIFMSLGRPMYCGIGRCAHCNINHKHVCIDGPMFSLEELEELEKED